jgi:hypothetical protein
VRSNVGSAVWRSAISNVGIGGVEFSDLEGWFRGVEFGDGKCLIGGVDFGDLHCWILGSAVWSSASSNV